MINKEKILRPRPSMNQQQWSYMQGELWQLREAKIIVLMSGDFYGNIIDCRFKDRQSGQIWRLSGVDDVYGGMCLEKG